MTAAVLLAYNPNDVKPGWVALVLVIALGVATYLLWRSMNTQLRKIQMPPKQTGTQTGPQPGTGTGGAARDGGSAPDPPSPSRSADRSTDPE